MTCIFNTVYYFGLPQKEGKGFKMLDVGCGDGHDVGIMDSCGWDAYGFELGEVGRKGKIFYEKSLEKTDFGDMKFDWIRVWHVFEHLTNPETYLAKMKDILSDEGTLVFAMPNTRSAAAFLFGKYYLGRDMPRHVIGFNDRNIERLFLKNGLRVIKVRYQSLNGFAGSLGNIMSEKFDLRLNWQSNPFWILVWLPVEYIVSLFRLSDQISIGIARDTVRDKIKLSLSHHKLEFCLSTCGIILSF